MSYMFYGCDTLISLSDNNKANINILNLKIQITSARHMFLGCKSLTSLPYFYIFNIYKNDIIFELVYKNNEDKVKILDKRFINKNKDKCTIVYKNSEIELKEYFEGSDKINKDIFKLLLCLDKSIKDISYIFNGCKTLISIKYYQINNQLYEIDNEFNSKYSNSKSSQSNFNINHNLSNSTIFFKDSIENLSEIFETSLQNNSDLFSLNENLISSSLLYFNKLINMNDMFSLCNSLISLPDLSKWNTSNVKYMSNLFSYCNSLISLPDISKWNTSNVTDMSEMFSGCNSLISLPDISKWNTSNVNNISHMFSECTSII